jgi:hypothetical protein
MRLPDSAWVLFSVAVVQKLPLHKKLERSYSYIVYFPSFRYQGPELLVALSSYFTYLTKFFFKWLEVHSLRWLHIIFFQIFCYIILADTWSSILVSHFLNLNFFTDLPFSAFLTFHSCALHLLLNMFNEYFMSVIVLFSSVISI